MVFALLGATTGARGNEVIRIMAGNLTSGNGQNYDLGHGNRIFQGLDPDIALVQEMNYLDNTAADFSAWVTTNFGSGFSYYRQSGSGIQIRAMADYTHA